MSGTTAAIEDASVRMSSVPLESVGYIPLEPVANSLQSFFAKPAVVANGTWSEGDARGYTEWSNSIASLLLGQTAWTNKLNGFLNFRGTAVFTVRLNATPFQRGRLLFHYLPFRNNQQNAGAYEAMHLLGLGIRTQHPNVEIDCRDTAGVLEIPYIAPTEYFDLKTLQIDWGNVYLDVLCPLADPTNNPVYYTVFLSWKDVELRGPWIPQSATGPRRKLRIASRTGEDAEQEAMSTGPVTSALRITKKAVDAVSSVPILSQFATTASWALGLAAGVSGYFGWSKPLLESPPTFVVPRTKPTMANATGADTCAPLHLYQTGAVTTMDDFAGTDQDEMSWAFLKSVPCNIGIYSWDTGDAANFTILTLNLGPTSLVETGSVTTGGHTYNWQTTCPALYLANQFALYRGSMRVTLKIVKTDYHSGRFMIVYTPYPTDTATQPTITNSLLAYREIVDIRTSSEITLEFPWLKNTDYLPIEQAYGTVRVIVLNELRAPSTVDQSVNFLVYVSGGDDFEIQAPSNLGPFGNADPQGLPFQPQMDTSALTKLAVKPVGTSTVKPISVESSANCVGEHFTSVKQLLLRYTRFFTRAATFEDAGRIWPWACGVSRALSTGIDCGVLGGDAYSIIAPMYALARGSVRIAAAAPPNPFTGSSGNQYFQPYAINAMAQVIDTYQYQTNIVDVGDSYVPYLLTASGTAVNYATKTPNPFVPYQEYDLGTNILTVNLIPNAKTPARIVCLQGNYVSAMSDPINQAPVDISQPGTFLLLKSAQPATTTGGWRFYRAFGDDLQLGRFIGAPPTLVSST